MPYHIRFLESDDQYSAEPSAKMASQAKRLFSGFSTSVSKFICFRGCDLQF
jgi:hypothetical protein